VTVVQKDGINPNDDPKDSVKFTYPKSKIFVGGLDFKLTSEELKEHFCKFGEVHDAIILKDIYTGSSRGFGFVTFTDEQVAQNLIKNNPVTEINGRRVDIKKAEPKDKSSRSPFPPREDGGGRGGGGGGRGGF
jgi:cold-inducible RNA-binding protein